MKTIHFISGLPRSGGTLLANLLAQNPRFRLAGTSGLPDLLLTVRNTWDRLEECGAMPLEESEAAKLRVLRGMMANFHPRHDGIVFDRSRTWLAHLEMAELILGRKVKVLVPVRDIRDILASLELFWRASAATRQLPFEAKDYLRFQSVPARCAAWMAEDGMVGSAYARVRDAFARGFGDRLHVIHYEEFTASPSVVLEGIYDFLDEEIIDHDTADVKSVIAENDRAYGMPGLHAISPVIAQNPSRWEEVLGDFAANYGTLNDFFERSLA